MKTNFFYFLLRNTSDARAGWIGLLRRTDKKFYWIDNCTKEVKYEKWRSSEPNNFGGVEDCGYLPGGNNGGTENDGSCLFSSRVALCQWLI